MTVIMGCQFPGSNQPPYPVTGDNETPFVAEETNPEYNSKFDYEQFYYLFIEHVDGKEDPDGDTVQFTSTSLPTYMSLDVNSGKITIDPQVETGDELIDFWSIDSHGADSKEDKLTVLFQFTGS
jgi:hypothetical protein